MHLDVFLAQMVHSMGVLSYLILFVIIFLERACVLTPFLPGDSLLFAAGALAANSELSLSWLSVFLLFACLSGMLVNYWVGCRCGQYITEHWNSRWINPDHIKRAHVFFEAYGISALMVCCFIPVLRTFTPFVAGIAMMNRYKYVIVSFISSLIWVGGILLVSYAFGNTSFVKEYFSWIILGMIIVPSAIPVLAYVKSLLKRR
ncbi:MAG: DedA family protein [Gammaproteobacteria bacterium]|nr:DedA family protein [Gammaproteobacteria bacterium]